MVCPTAVEGRDVGAHRRSDQEGEDFFGKTVILAARIASQAQGEQILVSSLLKALVESSGEFALGESCEVELKGLTGTHAVFKVVWPLRCLHPPQAYTSG